MCAGVVYSQRINRKVAVTMTHDELLEKIPTDFRAFKLQDALRAVVELHKPTPFTTPYCSGCYEVDDLYQVPYPCPTIQAIEKELK